MSNEQEEMQKTLADLQKRAEEFQAGTNYSSNNSSSGSSFSNSKIKTILAIVGLAVVFGLCIGIYLKTTGGGMGKPPASVKSMPTLNKFR